MTAFASALLPRESLQPLAALAMREAGADGYALFERDSEARLTCMSACGVRITPENIAGTGEIAVASFPLRSRDEVTGILAFGFAGRVVTVAAQRLLSRMAAAIERVWQLSDAAASLVRIATRIAELEAELADSKIASRTRGFLQSAPGNRDLIETVTRHVQDLTGRFESAAVFAQQVRLLEDELAERTITTRAKAFLQVTEGLSEEEAHVRLRLLSRKTRRPVREVALSVIAQSGGVQA